LLPAPRPIPVVCSCRLQRCQDLLCCVYKGNRVSISAVSVGRWLALSIWPLSPGVTGLAAGASVAASYVFRVVDEFGRNAVAGVYLALIDADDMSIIVGSGNIYYSS
jgi:hypothetical protein